MKAAISKSANIEGLKIISLGIGVQSTCLYYMSSMAQLPRADYAIFADLGREKKKSYEYLDFLLKWERENNGIPIIIIKEKNLYQDLLDGGNAGGRGFASIPAYTRNADGATGMLRRQCTGEYKIAQVDKKIRELYGIKPRYKMPQTELWKGISLDEIDRMSIPKNAWKIHTYPLLGYQTFYKKNFSKIEWALRMSRNNIIEWYNKHDLPVPPKSACTFCPFQSEKAWYKLKADDPEDFESACLVDDAIRNCSTKGISNPIFLHESGKPLREIEFKPDAPDLFHGECSGECHT